MSWLAVSIVQPNLMGTLAGALGGAAGPAATEPAAGLAGAVLATGAAAWPHAARPRPARARLVWRNVRRETWGMWDLLRPTTNRPLRPPRSSECPDPRYRRQ